MTARKAAKVSVQIVRGLYGVMSAGAAGGFVVTSGVFTKDAWKFALGTSMQLVDWSRLIEWFKAPNRRMLHQPVMSSVPAADSVRIVDAPEGDLEFNERVLSSSTNDGQECPRCGGAMTARYARAMNNGIAQNVFLGCLNFPACRGTRPL